MTNKQKIARARNWNKRMISGSYYSLRAMANVTHMAIGLTKEERQQVLYVADKIKIILDNWDNKNGEQ